MTTYIEFRCESGKVVSPELTVQDEVDLHRISCGICEQLSQLATIRDEEYRDVATIGDSDAKWLNEHADDDGFPCEISGDALAVYQERVAA